MGLLEILKGEQPGIINTILHYKNKGQFGEYATEFALTNYNIDGNFFIFQNLYVPYKNFSCEIDILMLHEKGIFVFESKDYSGWIFGTLNQQYWTQTFKSGQKFQFYNPIKQNNTHIKALSTLFQLPPQEFTSYIVFSAQCKLVRIPLLTENTIVVQRPDMLSYLRQDLASRSICYSLAQLESLANIIDQYAHPSEEEKLRHAKSVKDRVYGNICPFCGSPLVLRHGKYGEFLGCSTYPKCKFTRKRNF